MLLQGLVALVLLTSARAFNEDMAQYKWSPRYLYGARMSPIVYSGGSYPVRSSRYAGSSAMGATLSNYEGSLASRNPGFYGYNRNEMKRSACVDLGETCAVRSGLMGTMIKIPCCEGYTCSLMGRTFKCMDETLLGELEDTIMDEIMEDQDQDIAK